MSQLTFAEAEYAIKKRKARRERFLDQLETVIPCDPQHCNNIS